MKKLFTILSAVMLTVSLSAQTFGVRAGMNMSNLVEEDMEYTARIGIQTGVFGIFEISDVLTFNPEILYSQKGASMNVIDLEIELALDYLEIPLNMGYAVSEQLSINAGPYIGLLLNATLLEEDVSESMNSMDFGLNVGASFLLNESMQIGAHYGLGLNNVPDDDNVDVKHSNIQISVGYIIGGGYY
jgi:hypothetical protein